MDRKTLETLLIENWGTLLIKQLNCRKPWLMDLLQYGDLASDAKVFLGELFLVNFCDHVGAFHGTSEPLWLLQKFAKELTQSTGETVYGERRREHVAYAISMIAHSTFTQPPSAVAIPYLISQLEFLFRKNSKHLNMAGKVLVDYPPNVGKRKKDYYENSIEIAYILFRDYSQNPAASTFKRMDTQLKQNQVHGRNGEIETLDSIGKRLKWVRDNSLHGLWGDMSSEAEFIALLHFIFFHSL